MTRAKHPEVADHPGSGSRARFERIFAGNYQHVLAYALRRTSCEADAHDVVSQTFAVTWRRMDVVPEEQDVLPWLYGVARRCFANQRRLAANQARLSDRLGGEARVAEPSPRVGEENDSVVAVRDALSRLRPKDREILRLSAWEELSHAEIAVVLGTSENAVAIRLHRARHKLRDKLDPQLSNGNLPGGSR